MNLKQRCNMFNKIYKKYNGRMWIHPGEKDDEFYSYIIRKEVVIPNRTFTEPSEWDIFALLHEIGHVMTNTPHMKRCEQEYFATKWALREGKIVGFRVPDQYIKVYQDYIWKWRETSIKHNAKAVPSKKDLELVG